MPTYPATLERFVPADRDAVRRTADDAETVLATLRIVRRARAELLALFPVVSREPGVCCPQDLAETLAEWDEDFVGTLHTLRQGSGA